MNSTLAPNKSNSFTISLLLLFSHNDRYRFYIHA
ncbi:ankyrin repeat protein [Magpiepox virus 2]|nr:ankyrin repeat protein [Magpiepox virus 2]